MAKKKKKRGLKIFVDPFGNTINVWWGDPAASALSVQSNEPLTVIVKDKKDRAIGFERVGFFPKEIDSVKYLHFPKELYLESRRYLPSPR